MAHAMASHLATPGIAASRGATDWSREYALLKARFKVLQEDTLALADAYEHACEELEYEEECQELMVNKLAEIRTRRLNMFLRVPENAMMYFMEQKRAEMRARYPTAPRCDIKRRLADEWEAMTDEEQHVWTERYEHILAAHAPKKDAMKKKAVRKSVKGSPKKVAVKRKIEQGEGGEKKKRKPQANGKAKAAASVSEGEDGGMKVSSPNAKTPRPKAAAQPKRRASGVSSDAGTPTKAARKKTTKAPADCDVNEDTKPKQKVSTPKKTSSSPAKPKKSPTPKVKKPATPKKKPAEKKKSPAKRKIWKGMSDNDDDVDDPNDDDDDERRHSSYSQKDDDSGSSGGGSGSDEDDDEHMAQLPTGAFG